MQNFLNRQHTGSKFDRALFRIFAMLSSFSEFVSYFWKLMRDYFKLSFIIGPISLLVYLHRFGAPLPQIDLSFGIFFVIYISIIFIFVGVLGAYALAPTYFSFVVNDTIIHSYAPHLFSNNKFQKTRHLSIITNYVSVYSPMLIVSFVFMNSIYDSNDIFLNRMKIALVSAAFAAGLFAFLLPLSSLKNDINRYLLQDVGWRQKYRLFGAIAFANLVSIAWFIVYGAIFVNLTLSITRTDEANAYGLQMSIIILTVFQILHFVLTCFINRASVIIMCMFSVIGSSFAIIPGNTVLAAAGLRLIGAGGSAPASITLKVPLTQGQKSALEIIRGCIILSAPNQIIFREALTAEDCVIKNGLVKADKVEPSFSQIQVYNRADILTISGFNYPSLDDKSSGPSSTDAFPKGGD